MTPTTLQTFKLELERVLQIVQWAPTTGDLLRIARDIKQFAPTSEADLSGIVLQVYPKIRRLINEGLDNSDLRVLLALATTAAAEA